MDGEIKILAERMKLVQDEINKIEHHNEIIDERLLKLERSKEKTEYQYEQIMEALHKLNDETIPHLTIQIEELKNKPIKRYDTTITAILSAFFGSMGTLIASMLLKK